MAKRQVFFSFEYVKDIWMAALRRGLRAVVARSGNAGFAGKIVD